MVSALVSGSSGLSSSPGLRQCVVFLGKRHNSHSASPHPGVYLGTAEFNDEGTEPCHGLAPHPGGSRDTPSRFMLQKPEIRVGLMGHLARMQTLPNYLHKTYSRPTQFDDSRMEPTDDC